jgi:hypothetical protein
VRYPLSKKVMASTSGIVFFAMQTLLNDTKWLRREESWGLGGVSVFPLCSGMEENTLLYCSMFEQPSRKHRG